MQLENERRRRAAADNAAGRAGTDDARGERASSAPSLCERPARGPPGRELPRRTEAPLPLASAPARKGGWWDANKVGLSPPLIEPSRGWLMLYHGVRHNASGALYRLGVALYALDKPEHCLLRGDSWIFGPEAPCEGEGEVANVVFPCGYTIGADQDTLHRYYSAADTCVALARVSVRKPLQWLDRCGLA
ncbi:MAG: hypothetical protein IPL40_13665 [Proteobacteria bacterium]|nr:hypothetical protein [Pseudomonadota bacterium]